MIDKTGQVWQETWGDKTFLFLVLEVDRSESGLSVYKLLNLETGAFDWVGLPMLDNPEDEWEQIA